MIIGAKYPTLFIVERSTKEKWPSSEGEFDVFGEVSEDNGAAGPIGTGEHAAEHVAVDKTSRPGGGDKVFGQGG